MICILTGNVLKRNLGVLGSTTDQADGDGDVLEGIRGSPLDGVGGAGVDLLIGGGLRDGVEVGVLGQGGGSEGQEGSGGDLELHFDELSRRGRLSVVLERC